MDEDYPTLGGSEKSQEESLGNSEPAAQGQIERLISALEAINAGINSPNEDQRADRDLAAQEDMAEWAFWMVIAAVAQIVLSCAGIYLIYRTLFYTRKALDEAADATKAAQATVKVMRDAERPYVIPRNIRLENLGNELRHPSGGHFVEVRFDYENVGRSVAFVMANGIAHEICREGQQGTLPLDVFDGLGKLPIRADAFRDFGTAMTAFQISPEDSRAIDMGLKSLYVYGFVRYSDLFGVTRETGFIYELYPDREKTGGEFVFCTPHPYWFDRVLEPDAS